MIQVANVTTVTSELFTYRHRDTHGAVLVNLHDLAALRPGRDTAVAHGARADGRVVGGEGHVPGDHVSVTDGEDLQTVGELLVPEAHIAVLASGQVALLRGGEGMWEVTA